MLLSRMSRPLLIAPIDAAVNTPRYEPPVANDVTAPLNVALQYTVVAKMLSVLPLPFTAHDPRLITPEMFTGPSVGCPEPRPLSRMFG